MNAIGIALRLLPMLIRLVEVIYGARQGQLKKDAVLALLFGVLNIVAPGLDTPELRQLLGEAIDQIIAALNDAGVFKSSPPRPPDLQGGVTAVRRRAPAKARLPAARQAK